jgi:GrpB-like predicted nucleotidyltransferase (UPF0157 family)
MLGLKRGIVRLVPYDTNWQAVFQAEKALLIKAIGPYVLDIQHVGSTSIPSALAKPIIDIAAAVVSLDGGLKCIEPLGALGYEYKHDAGIPGRHFFAKGPGDCRTHYLHIEEMDGELWSNHIRFRDYLIAHGEYIKEYNDTKRALAARYADDRDAYSAGKDGFIKRVLGLAEAEISR